MFVDAKRMRHHYYINKAAGECYPTLKINCSLLNKFMIEFITFSRTNGRFVLKWTMEVVYRWRHKKKCDLEIHFLNYSIVKNEHKTWFSNIILDNSFKQTFYVAENVANFDELK